MQNRPAFQKLQDFRADLDRRTGLLQGREREIINALVAQEEALDEAILTGKHQAVQESIGRLKTELLSCRRELQTLENPPPGGILGKLRQDALNEIREGVAEKRQYWQEDLRKRLEAKKSEFLTLVEEAGRLHREGSSLVSAFTEIALSIPGVKPGTPAFMTDILMRPDRKEGMVYVTPEETEKSFRKGA
jgi:hypothetical protein